MNTPENKVIQSIKNYVTEHGGVIYNIHLGARGIRGLPDKIIILNSVTYLVEIKAKGERPKPHQLDRIDEINRHGGIAFWCQSLEDFKDKLDTNTKMP
jgi:hypothetical protein